MSATGVARDRTPPRSRAPLPPTLPRDQRGQTRSATWPTSSSLRHWRASLVVSIPGTVPKPHCGDSASCPTSRWIEEVVRRVRADLARHPPHVEAVGQQRDRDIGTSQRVRRRARQRRHPARATRSDASSAALDTMPPAHSRDRRPARAFCNAHACASVRSPARVAAIVGSIGLWPITSSTSACRRWPSARLRHGRAATRPRVANVPAGRDRRSVRPSRRSPVARPARSPAPPTPIAAS
jgi:hypothetical protein